ncbi:ERF family protein [Lacticaseibacillus paracasei subsp. tolerans]|uniref:ERF family protein n=2 Tax=Lacticaseibacillus paracasei TaxID=1597 RepID=A0ABD5D159_LACPA|nr:ERF family protein [Lacticaseibacillus paracasei]MDR7625005.1 ERF family protein [Lacticaseibacillus paracasei]QPC13378.1 ERF family protein [Lacticaseibacillus paracasei subsp. tolerans]QUT00124.1 ERF family protein [Lacticaseibacillus paracasei subsp. tolerans]
MRTSEDINEIAKAINAFRQVVKQPTKDGDNPFLKSRYVQLEGVVDAIDRALPDTGLAYTQDVVSEGNQVSVTTLIFHSSGQFIELGPLSVPVAKNDAQAFGSAETYARRYSLSAAFGITSDLDDDGTVAGVNPPKAQPKRTTKPNGSLDHATVSAIKELIMQQFSKMPKVNKNGDPKPKTVNELAEIWIGIANAKFGSKATSIETLTPSAASGIKNLLENEIKKLAGVTNENQRQAR